MKRIFIFLLFITHISNSQTIKGIIKDSLTQAPLAYSSIALLNNKGTYSDENGNFELDIRNYIYDTLKISTVGYKSKIIPLNIFKNKEIIKLNIFLSSKIEELEEVVISSKKIKYKNKVTLGEERDGNIDKSSLIGYETCIKIDNPKKINGKIKRVYVELKKNKKANYIATFNVKFYEFDSKKNLPGKELYNKNIFIEPKNKKYRLWINLKDFNIKFPENGVCVGIEMVNTIGKVEKYAFFGPLFRYTLSENDKSITWSNYLNTGWKDGSNAHKKFKKFKTGTSNPMIGIEVLYPSN